MKNYIAIFIKNNKKKETITMESYLSVKWSERK